MTTAEVYQSSRQRLEAFLQKQNMVLTQEREVILRAVCELKQPFETDELVDAIKESRITRATVYNALPLLTESGVLYCSSRQAGRRKAQYELRMGTHNVMQIICRRCGRVSDFREVAIENIAKQRKYSNFVMERFSMVVYGVCKTCRRRQNEDACQM